MVRRLRIFGSQSSRKDTALKSTAKTSQKIERRRKNKDIVSRAKLSASEQVFKVEKLRDHSNSADNRTENIRTPRPQNSGRRFGEAQLSGGWEGQQGAVGLVSKNASARARGLHAGENGSSQAVDILFRLLSFQQKAWLYQSKTDASKNCQGFRPAFHGSSVPAYLLFSDGGAGGRSGDHQGAGRTCVRSHDANLHQSIRQTSEG